MAREPSFSIETLKELAGYGIHASDLSRLLRSKHETDADHVTRISITQLVQGYLIDLRALRLGRIKSKKTVEVYAQIVWDFRSYSTDLQIEEISSSMLSELMNGFLNYKRNEVTKYKTVGISVNTYNKYLSVMRSLARFGIEKYGLGRIALNKNIESNELLPRALPEEEISKLLHLARMSRYGLKTHLMIAMYVGLGLRRSELVNIRVRDVSLAEYTVIVTGKRARQRIVVFPIELVSTIQNYISLHQLRGKDYLFQSAYNKTKPMSTRAVDRIAHRLFKNLESYDQNEPSRRYTVHSLRHTYAVTLLEHGLPLRMIGENLGHQSMESTRIYTKLDTKRLKSSLAPGLDKLAELMGYDK